MNLSLPRLSQALQQVEGTPAITDVSEKNEIANGLLRLLLGLSHLGARAIPRRQTGVPSTTIASCLLPVYRKHSTECHLSVDGSATHMVSKRSSVIGKRICVMAVFICESVALYHSQCHQRSTRSSLDRSMLGNEAVAGSFPERCGVLHNVTGFEGRGLQPQNACMTRTGAYPASSVS